MNKFTNWSFESDQVNDFAFWKEVFTPEECKTIIDLGKSNEMKKGTAEGSDDVRDSKISWIYVTSETEWIFRKVTDIVMALNSKYFGFDLFGLAEGFQFTEYHAPTGKYDAHVDKRFGGMTRKLSLTIQLSNESEYEGGELTIYRSLKPEFMPKEQGTLVAFPSYVVHEVKPVSKGSRYSLVAWVTGKPFK